MSRGASAPSFLQEPGELPANREEMSFDQIPVEPDRPRPPKPALPQEKFGISRQYWLPLLSFVGGSLLFIIVDLLCLALSRMTHPAVGLVRDLPR